MRRINDSRLYLIFGLTVLVVGILLSGISLYSYKIIKPRVTQLIEAKENLEDNYSKAYLILRSPQIFARYENFDDIIEIDKKYKMAEDRNYEDSKKLAEIKNESYTGTDIKNILLYFDSAIYSGKEMTPMDGKYLNGLLNRRMKGAALGRNTAVYCFLLAFIAMAFFVYEKKKTELIA